MQYSGDPQENSSNPDGSSMRPIQSHCMALNDRLRQTLSCLSTPTNMNQSHTMHGPGGHGHDYGDEHQ